MRDCGGEYQVYMRFERVTWRYVLYLLDRDTREDEGMTRRHACILRVTWTAA